MELFEYSKPPSKPNAHAPLAERVRPKSLEELVGQNLDTDERAVYIPADVMVEAARQIMLQLAQAV